MSRNFVAFGVVALIGAVLVLPDPSSAAGRGVGGGFRMGVRAPVFIPRSARAGILRARPFALGNRGAVKGAAQFLPPDAPNPTPRLARTTVRAPFVRLQRQHHRASYSGWIFPITTDDNASYIGTPYDPGEAIPVYAPTVADPADPPAASRPMPRISSTGPRDENQDACRSERVTVPAADGEREITVVRC